MDEIGKMSEDFKLMVKQQTKIAELEAEIVHLKELLAGSTPLIGDPSIHVVQSLDKAELIAVEQISKLKDVSAVQELSLDQTRKLVEYHKILNNKNKNNKGLSDLEKLPIEDLLSIVEDKK